MQEQDTTTDTFGPVLAVAAGVVAAVHVAYVVATPGHAWGALGDSLGAVFRRSLGVGEGLHANPLVFFLVLALEVAALVAVVVLVSRRRSRRGDVVSGGAASGAKLRKAARGTNKKEQLTEPFAFLGATPLRMRHTDTVLLVAPPQVGKTTRFVVPGVLDAQGPTVVTSTKVDVLRLTHEAAAKRGRVHVFDPERLSRWPDTVTWDVVGGCEDPVVATERARAITAADPLDAHGSTNAGFFEKATREVLKGLLHAAALKGGGTIEDVRRWAGDFNDEEPFIILRENREAAKDWGGDLATYTRGAASETVASTQQSLAHVLAPVKIDATIASVLPGPRQFRVRDFLDSNDTLYLLCQSGQEGSAAPLVTAFVSEIERVARKESQLRAGGRLERPLTLLLDEAANIAPIPNLPSLMSDGAGRGVLTRVVVQAWTQLVQRWGEHGAATIFDAASVKLALGGVSDTDFLGRLSDLSGTKEVRRTSEQKGQHGSWGSSTSVEREATLRPDEIHELAEGKAYLKYRAQSAAIVTLRAWWERRDAKATRASEAAAMRKEGLA